jgi:hypothetical protein
MLRSFNHFAYLESPLIAETYLLLARFFLKKKHCDTDTPIVSILAGNPQKSI